MIDATNVPRNILPFFWFQLFASTNRPTSGFVNSLWLHSILFVNSHKFNETGALSFKNVIYIISTKKWATKLY